MPPGESSVVYHKRYAALNRAKLLRYAMQLSRELASGRSFHCLITDDRAMRGLNRQYRGKDKTTDVLSFPAMNGSVLGDLAISYDRAREQAAELRHTIQAEVSILMLHGLLHLVGMDHDADSGQMAARETALRKRFGLPAGLIERSRA